MEGEQLTNIEDWVKRRYECSPLDVFLKLKSGAEEDVKARKEIAKKDNEAVVFAFLAIDEVGFKVTRTQQWKNSYSVELRWGMAGFVVKDQDDSVLYHATLTLTDKGNCKLKLKTGEELEFWQFRKRVLEDLFFNLTGAG